MAKRPNYAAKKASTGMLEMGERVATTPRRKNPKGGYTESGMSEKSPMSAKNVKKRMLDPRKPL